MKPVYLLKLFIKESYCVPWVHVTYNRPLKPTAGFLLVSTFLFLGLNASDKQD